MWSQAAQEKSELRQVRGSNAETQWRQIVKNMEAWNRIVMNLVRVCQHHYRRHRHHHYQTR